MYHRNMGESRRDVMLDRSNYIRKYSHNVQAAVIQTASFGAPQSQYHAVAGGPLSFQVTIPSYLLKRRKL